MSRAVEISAKAVAAIREEAERAYPNEGCGALLGSPSLGILETVAIANREAEAPRIRFTVDPQDYVRVENEAEARGLDLVGFWHSHPDHPARPSPTDRRYAWEGLLTLVIAVETGKSRDLTAWEIEGEGFRERSLLESGVRKEA
jgi:proteasome lid subunit RPN8/RPN11